MPAPKSTLGIISPVEAQNYVLNPSAETTGNFSNQASGTVTRVTTFQKYGLYSYQVVTTAAADGGNFTLLALPNSANYVTFRVKMSNVRLNITIGSATREAVFLEKIDSQWRLFGAAFTASETSGQANLRITQIGSGANTFYLDGLQVSPVIEGRYYSTYIDGTQEGARWLGAPHASASMRSGQSRAGGVVRDFYRDYGFVVERIIGGGSVTEDLSIDAYAMLPGGELNNSKIQPREFSLVGYFLADTEEALHENIQRLELEVGLNTYPSQQPFRLRFSGARVLKEISARYAGGLEGDLPIYYDDCLSVEDEKWVKNRFWRTRAAVQMVAEDPFWYEVGESAALLDTNDTATLRYLAGRIDGEWSNLGLSADPTTGGAILTIALGPDNKVYFGGSFTGLNGVAGRDYIAAYNLATGLWETVGSASDFNAAIAVLKFGPDGTLYAGGDFTNVHGVAAADFIARKPPGADWTNLGTPFSGAAAITRVSAIAIDNFGDIYIGGDFQNWANLADADRVVYWDTSAAAYAAVIAGANGEVRAIAVDPDGQAIYFGGEFTNWGDANGDGIVKWDYSALSSLSTGANNNVTTLAIGPDKRLYIGGLMTTLGGITVNGIGLWNGQNFEPLGSGVENINDVESSAIGPDGLLHIGGQFSVAGGISLADGVAAWNQYSWAHLGLDLPGSAIVWALTIGASDPVVLGNYDLFIGFSTTGTGAFSGIVTTSNEGSAVAFPRIIINRTGGTGAIIQSIRNERTGLTLLCDYTLLDGETVIIDLYPKDRSEVSSFFGDTAIVLPNSNMSQWSLLPGSNQISAFVSESGSPAIVGYLLWRDSFRSYN